MRPINEHDLIPGCQHFTWHEALWLPQWRRLAVESDGLTDEILNNLTVLFQKLETVRSFLNGRPILVHVAFRSQAYNSLPTVKGAKSSAHLFGMAVDFHVVGIDCDQAKQMILDGNKLDEWGMRMEDNGAGAPWIHLDTRALRPGGKRFF